jgi:hypothetical protein
MTTQTVKTSQLRIGDVVLAHGLRLLIDRPLLESTAHPVSTGPTLYTQALVLNRDEVPNSVVPIAWTREWNRSGPSNDEHRWTVQGNDLAQWQIERPDLDAIEPASERVPRVHEFDSTSTAYDMSQCDDEIADGDVLVVRSERAVAVLLEAWPVAITALVAGEHFHVADETLDFQHVESTSKPGTIRNYRASIEIAAPIIAELSA